MKKELDLSNVHMDKIKRASSHSTTFPKAFEEISKNEGVAFLSLDPTETHLQILHHGLVLGGNWNSPSKKLVAILGHDSEAKPVQIVQKSIKSIKEKSFNLEELQDSLGDEESFKKLEDPDVDFLFKNILLILNSLTKIFVSLDAPTPFNVAKAFLEKFTPDSDLNKTLDSSASSNDSLQEQMRDKGTDSASVDEFGKMEDLQKAPVNSLKTEDFTHVIQFCHLCSLGKITPVLYSLANDPEISDWFKSLRQKLMIKYKASTKRPAPYTTSSTPHIRFYSL